MWHLYIIRCGDDTLYTGITTDVARRFGEHECGGPKAAKYLRGRGPLRLVAQIKVGDRARAHIGILHSGLFCLLSSLP